MRSVNALCQFRKGAFDLFPDADDVTLERIIGFPEMHKGCHQSGNCSGDRQDLTQRHT